jgi:hypothetical protein
MICPQCKGEYQVGFTICPTCEIPLVSTPANLHQRTGAERQRYDWITWAVAFVLLVGLASTAAAWSRGSVALGFSAVCFLVALVAWIWSRKRSTV